MRVPLERERGEPKLLGKHGFKIAIAARENAKCDWDAELSMKPCVARSIRNAAQTASNVSASSTAWAERLSTEVPPLDVEAYLLDSC